MSKTIAEQISALEAKRAASAARMEQVMEKSLAESRTTDAAEQEEFDTLSAEVDAIDKDLVRLRKIENSKMSTAKAVTKIENTIDAAASRGGLDRPWAVPMQKAVPLEDYVWRSLVCKVKGHFTKQSPYDVMREEYGDDEPTKAVMNVITRAATVPADT